MPNKNEFPEPGSQVENPAIYGPVGPNGEAPHMTMGQFQAWQHFQMQSNAAGTPAPPGFASYEQWAASVTLSLVQKLAADAGIS